MTRLIDVLKEMEPSYSARALKRALEANICRVNGKIERFASALVKKGDVIELAPHWNQMAKKEKEVNVLYEDEELKIIDKPAGMVCRDERSLFLAHRLDKDTTGILVFAKQPAVARELHELFKERLVEKEYLAVVDGIPRQESGLIQSHLVKKGSFQGQTIWGSTSQGQGLLAETSWTLLRSLDDCSLLLCQPRTGRTHQIRVHLAEMSHPILVDRQYASRFRSRRFAARPLLHAYRLRFPWRGKLIEVEAPVPKDFLL